MFKEHYQELQKMLKAEWPGNEIINFVFLGDSITAGYRETPHISMHESYASQFLLWVNRTYPTALVNLINAGVGGWGVKEGLETLDKNVISHRPDFMTICYGMNDFLQGPGYLSEFKTLYIRLIEKLRAAGIEHILLLTTIPFFEGTDDGKKFLQDFGLSKAEEVQKNFMDTIIEVGKETRLPVADVYSLWKTRQSQTASPVLFYSNRINHPSDAGHGIIAEALVKKFKELLE